MMHQHGDQQDKQTNGMGGMNAMGLLMGGGTAVLVAVLLAPSLGWPIGIGISVVAGVVMFAMHGGAMGGHGSGSGGHRGHGC